MRVKSSLLNITVGVGNQLIITILSFVSRTVFINSLGIEYLGINALFTSILAMLSLAEAGIGSSIIYNLYKPVALNDKPKILALMNLYKKAYLTIAGVVFLLGLALLPFLGFFVKDTSVSNITFIYLIFLLNTAVPYLFVHKQSFLNVNQKNYIVTAAFSVSAIISTSLKIAILYYTENYILYLVVESAITIATSIVLAQFVNRMYPLLKERMTAKLDPETKAAFLKNMKAIILQNIGNYFIFGVESILISSFVSVIAVGLYSNYQMLITLARTFLNQIFSNLYHSVGNLVAQESTDKIYQVFRVTYLLNFWLYSLACIGIYVLVQPLIEVWLGDNFLMESAVLAVLAIQFYERGMRNTITTVKTTAGIFHQDRFAPLVQAAINLAVSIVLVHFFGILGVFIGGTISALAVPFWRTPQLVYREVFHKPLRQYYLRYTYYTVIGLVTCWIVQIMTSYIGDSSYLHIALQAVVLVLTINIIYVILFYRTEEFKYLLSIMRSLLINIVPAKLQSKNRLNQSS